MKRLIPILVILSLILSSMNVLAESNPVTEHKNSVQDAVKKANEEIGFPYYNRMDDDWAGGVLDTRNWIETPWEDPNISGATEKPWNNNPEWNDAMIAGLKYAYGDGITNGAMSDWTKYAQILQPPTGNTWGMGRMWHVTSAGKVWYITIRKLRCHLIY